MKQAQLPQKVVLSFSHKQSKFIKSFPLHHSQNTIIDTKGEFRIELLLHPTYDFVMELLSMGSEVVVLEPETLKNQIITILQKSLDSYKHSKT